MVSPPRLFIQKKTVSFHVPTVLGFFYDSSLHRCEPVGTPLPLVNAPPAPKAMCCAQIFHFCLVWLMVPTQVFCVMLKLLEPCLSCQDFFGGSMIAPENLTTFRQN
jgi:hypothetical protein